LWRDRRSGRIGGYYYDRAPVKTDLKKKRARHTKLIVSKNFIHRTVIFAG